MFFFTKPSKDDISHFLDRAERDEFSYIELGTTLNPDQSPDYVVDHNRIAIGRGLADLDIAKDAIRRWKMFDFPWIEVHPQKIPIEPDYFVAILIRHFGFYSLNSARIVYSIDEPLRFGFAYGTLTGHAEIGEERFSVELDPESDTVTYDIFAVSRPGHIFAKIGFPLTRLLQKRFAADSMRAMKDAIQNSKRSDL